jgi:DNA polymerase III subunit delta'
MYSLPWHEPVLTRILSDKPRLPHALLIHGPEGIGKSVFATAVAHGLLCESPKGIAACGKCPACLWLEAGNHPDLRVLEPANPDTTEADDQTAPAKGSAHIVIEQVRELADFINISSHRGGAKVVLIQPAEALNVNAANALLKSLEEPPAGVYFILMSHRPHFLPATIRSRCRHIPLACPEAGAAAEWLLAQGVRDPQLALAHTGNAAVLAHELSQGSYWTDREGFLAALSARNLDPIAMAEQVNDVGLGDVLSWLQKWTFDLVLQRTAGKVRYNPDHGKIIAALAQRINPVTMLRYHRALLQMQRIVHHPLNLRLLLEQLLIDYRNALSAPSQAGHAH